MLATTPIAMILLLITIYESILTVSATSSSNDADLDYYYKRMYDFGLGKRAYTYSANKRPQYDFGIGKRSLDSNRQKLYAFGLGKRFTSNNDNIYDYYDEDIPHDDLNKRIKPYEFGLGKRAAPAPYSFGLGKRYNGGNSGQGKLYSFGLGKRGYNNYNKNQMGISQRSQRYNFGIGKRDVNDDLGEFFASLDNDNNDKQHNVFTRASQKYNFGLGKRSSYTDLNDLDSDNDFVKRGQRFNFGLGKRNIEDFSDLIPYEDGLNEQHDLYTRASQKFNFGLGKREVSKEELQLLQEDILPTLMSSTEINSNNVSDQPNHTSNTRKREINFNDENNEKQHQITLTNQMH